MSTTTTPPLSGTSLIGFSRGSGTEVCGHAHEAEGGERLDPAYFSATDDEIESAVGLADAAFPDFSARPGKERAGFLRAIAIEIEEVADAIVARGMLETGLPEGRLRGETARTTGQLRMFADLISEGSWVDARIDRALPDRQPLPKPDIRSMLRPLGPVAVFCPSNFPMAYSVAGGDVASALAAGCPVIVIGHHSHPGVAEITGLAVRRAAQATGMPEGVHSLLYGGGQKVGVAVVRHPVIQAVGFTGSRAGGTSLMEVAANRPQPIPVYAEMSSTNPVVLLPGALARGEEALAEGFFQSLTLGVGQFCTNPGLVFLPEGHGEGFLAKLKSLVEASSPATMLNGSICKAFAETQEGISQVAGVETLARSATVPSPTQGAPVVFTVSMRRFLEDEFLQGEMFGPGCLIVRGSMEEIEASISGLEGQLTATIHGTDEELATKATLVEALQRKAGRLICNGFPTGLEVCPSTVHGGPYPSTSDGRSSSVGTMAILRFARPVAWQGFPQPSLPLELQDHNPLRIARLVDGEREEAV